eukprot:gnl/Spiro4/22900_TR11294_c0_g1_i1.p1 gnl/Spiro4/22900_TR11294_c0_g1~~gnl/Spiro4/22900_TR11294_c0_g1_i1.p1  ORF type:complete len:589 (-),score=171.38 gnl/Spiro4/22900_TR11294_c0_g1_i1:119-1855(-)
MMRGEVDESIPFDPVIHFTVSSISKNHLNPWARGTIETGTGTGFVIPGRRIITNNHVVSGRDATHIQVSRHGKPGSFSAKLLCTSPIVDLAVLTVEDAAFWEDLPCVDFQMDVPALHEHVVAVGYPLGAESVTVTEGIVSNVKMFDISLGMGQETLCVQIDAAVNPGNSGGPCFSMTTGGLVGVVFCGGGGENTNFIIPTLVVKQFLDVFERTGTFGLLPSLGISYQRLVNPGFRRLCFGGTMPSHHNGVLVDGVGKFGCSAGKLKKGDILMAIDDNAISEEGDVVFRGSEWLPFNFLVTQKSIGDTVTLRVLRSPSRADDPTAPREPAELHDITITLAPETTWLRLVSGVDYFCGWAMIGGFVFVRSGYPLQVSVGGSASLQLGVFAADWMDSVYPIENMTDEILLCQEVVAHEINMGFGPRGETLSDRGLVLLKFNGVRVRNLMHLRTMYEECKSPYIELRFISVIDKTKERVVLETAAVRATESEFLSQLVMPHWWGSEGEPSPTVVAPPASTAITPAALEALAPPASHPPASPKTTPTSPKATPTSPKTIPSSPSHGAKPGAKPHKPSKPKQQH